MSYFRKFPLIVQIKDIISESLRGWLEHDASTMGAALAFYTVFSIAPILIIATGVVSIVVQGDMLRADLLSQAQNLLGPAGANAVKELLMSADFLANSRFATSVGVITLLFGASSVFVELQNSLDRIWEIPKRKRMNG